MLVATSVSELGRMKFDWWPDWSGKPVAIIACGPSAKDAEIELLRGKMFVLAIKQSVDLCPWADAVYGCDAPWWLHRNGLPEFKGLKLAWEARACEKFRDLKKVEIPDKLRDELLLDEPLKVGAGGNSGFQALNIAVQFGARRIVLIGFDMQDRSGQHWYGRNNWPEANNPDESNFRRWRAAFDQASAQLVQRGVEVVNASSISAMKCFSKRSLAEIVRDWA